jgi:hypothetical protein
MEMLGMAHCTPFIAATQTTCRTLVQGGWRTLHGSGIENAECEMRAQGAKWRMLHTVAATPSHLQQAGAFYRHALPPAIFAVFAHAGSNNQEVRRLPLQLDPLPQPCLLHLCRQLAAEAA